MKLILTPFFFKKKNRLSNAQTLKNNQFDFFFLLFKAGKGDQFDSKLRENDHLRSILDLRVSN